MLCSLSVWVSVQSLQLGMACPPPLHHIFSSVPVHSVTISSSTVLLMEFRLRCGGGGVLLSFTLFLYVVGSGFLFSFFRDKDSL